MATPMSLSVGRFHHERLIRQQVLTLAVAVPRRKSWQPQRFLEPVVHLPHKVGGIFPTTAAAPGCN